MRFSASRIGKFNEYLYTFFKCLSTDRIDYVENWYSEQSDTGEDIAARRLDRAAALPAPPCRPRAVRVDRRHHPHLRAAQLEIRPRDGRVPDLARPRDPRPAPRTGRDHQLREIALRLPGFPRWLRMRDLRDPPSYAGLDHSPDRRQGSGGRRGRQELVQGVVPPRVRPAVGAAWALQPGALRQDRSGQVDPDQRDLRRGGRPHRHRRAGDPGSHLYLDKVGHLGIVDTQGLEIGKDDREILTRPGQGDQGVAASCRCRSRSTSPGTASAAWTAGSRTPRPTSSAGSTSSACR